MSERPLPDDLEQWPDDPRQLLGVSFSVTPRDLRRAYNRLIRIYKPEQSPEEFRRIREAYESLLRFAELFAPSAEPFDAPPTEPLPMPSSSDSDAECIEVPSRSEESAEEIGRFRAPMPRPEEELEELWQRAIAGAPAEAYARLVQMSQQADGQTEVYLRLYWLLRLFPEVDARRMPADWLVRGLLMTGLAGPLRQLYREEVADDPAEALSQRYDRLLEAPLPAGSLADLVEWRLQAAARLERWDVLSADLARFRPRFGPGEEALWLRLVFALADGVAWSGDPEGVRLLAACREEVARHEHLASTLSGSFDRFDFLMEASMSWLKLCRHGGVPVAMLRLIGASWTRPLTEVRTALMDILRSMTDAPGRWLGHLDEIQQNAPAALAVLGELFDQFEASHTHAAEPREPELTRGLVLSFLPRVNAADYHQERLRILSFCVREDITPEEMAEADSCTGGWEELGATWARTLLADWPLRYVCRACRLFWGC